MFLPPQQDEFSEQVLNKTRNFQNQWQSERETSGNARLIVCTTIQYRVEQVAIYST